AHALLVDLLILSADRPEEVVKDQLLQFIPNLHRGWDALQDVRHQIPFSTLNAIAPHSDWPMTCIATPRHQPCNAFRPHSCSTPCPASRSCLASQSRNPLTRSNRSRERQGLKELR